VRVGTLAFIGGCSRVAQDVPPFATVVGYPAKIFGLNTEGLRRAEVPEEIRQRLHRAFKTLFHSKLSMRHAVEEAAKETDACSEVAHLLEFIRHSKRGVCRA